MGIEDRDYMQERNRNNVFGASGASDRPFTAPQEGPSFLVLILFWLGVGLLLYFGYERLLAQRKQEPSPVQPATAAGMRAHEGQRQQRSPEQHVAKADPLNDRARVRSEGYVPPGSHAARSQREEQSAPSTGGTLYLCRTYTGGTFWAQAHCAQHQALIERIVPVPPGLPFQEQVRVAEQYSPATETTVRAPVHVNVRSTTDARTAECKALDARVQALDADARHPHSGQMQDWIRQKREEARSRQFELRC